MRAGDASVVKEIFLLAGLLMVILLTGGGSRALPADAEAYAASNIIWAQFSPLAASALPGQCSALLAGEDARSPRSVILSLKPENMLMRRIADITAVPSVPKPEQASAAATIASRGRVVTPAPPLVETDVVPRQAPAPPNIIILPEAEKLAVANEPEAAEDEIVPVAAFKNKTILTYCTHSSESYIPDSGVARQEGQAGLINTVAERMDRQLRRYGFKARHDDAIHDAPSYNDSYANSRSTVERLLADSRNTVALFDIHRDSIPGADDGGTVTIKGNEAAQILIIVGTDGVRAHPHWEQNYAFAQELYRLGEEKYPGLIRGVRTHPGSYHQEYHTGALLLEMGNDQNTLEEAIYAAELFAGLLADYFK
ncbi:MAG: stage II sporulation protein P [Syntrophomonadaceae bacterium]|nr:stage II sporulation protein P [Syntrophomonadaceae bacterium]